MCFKQCYWLSLVMNAIVHVASWQSLLKRKNKRNRNKWCTYNHILICFVFLGSNLQFERYCIPSQWLAFIDSINIPRFDIDSLKSGNVYHIVSNQHLRYQGHYDRWHECSHFGKKIQMVSGNIFMRRESRLGLCKILIEQCTNQVSDRWLCDVFDVENSSSVHESLCKTWESRQIIQKKKKR